MPTQPSHPTPLEALLASPQVGLEVYDSKGGLLEANDIARAMFGMEGELPKYNLFESPFVEEGLKRTLKAGKPYLRFIRFEPGEAAFASTLTEGRWSAVAILPRPDPSGAQGWLAIYGDA
ncbi:hypothetical protein IIA16_02520 [bacterium]|nr:hypothetical protein [bacterium]